MNSAIEEFWSAFLGCDAEFLNQSSIVLVPRLLDDAYEGYYLFQRGDGVVVSVMSNHPASLFQKIESAIGSTNPSDVFTRLFWETKFAGAYQRLAGPAVIHYTDQTTFHSVDAPTVRALSGKNRNDSEALRHLFGQCTIEEWEHSGIQFDHDPIFGSFEQERLVAACSCEMWSSHIAHIGVATSQKHRGRGHGAAVVCAATAKCLEEKQVPQYRTLASNEPAMAIARSLGFREYARTMSVTVHDPD